jgi:hypothetical protein
MQKHENKNAAHKGSTPNNANTPSKPAAQDKAGARTQPGGKKTDREDPSEASHTKKEANEHPEGKRTK